MNQSRLRDCLLDLTVSVTLLFSLKYEFDFKYIFIADTIDIYSRKFVLTFLKLSLNLS